MPNLKPGICGIWRIERRSRESGLWLPSLVGLNTIQAQGKYDFLDLMFDDGVSSSTPFTAARAQLLIYDTGDVLKKTLTNPTITHGADDSGEVEYKWSDETVDAYEADDLHFKNGTTGHTFSIKLGTGWSKPATENWYYYYTLYITQNGDTDLKMDGLDHALRLFTGNRSFTSKQWAGTPGDLYITVEDSTRTDSEDVDYDSGYPSRSGTTVTIVFTAGLTEAEISWYYVAVNAMMVTEGEKTLSETAENFGTKPAGSQEWEYTFTFSL